AGDDFRVHQGASATAKGVILVWDEAEVRDGSENTRFELRGRLVSKRIRVGPRSEWRYDSSTWSTLYSLFTWQLDQLGTKILNFPEFMAVLGRNPAPKIRFLPETASRVDHFTTTLQHVYAPGTGDAG